MPAALLDGDGELAYHAPPLHGVRTRYDRTLIPARMLAISDAIIVVGETDIIYLTADGSYLPSLYPKPWPYARHLMPGSKALKLDIAHLPVRRLSGTLFAPFTVAGNWFHRLFDNYARLYFFGELGGFGVRIAVPHWATAAGTTAAREAGDRAAVEAAFLDGLEIERLERGVYRVERLIAPPPANARDYIFSEPARFVAGRLAQLTGARYTHRTRLFVSRADIPVRNLVNEAELAEALRRLGFLIVCPGDFSFRAQLELFASAEIIVGAHGQGLTPIIAASGCRMLMEFEAAGWGTTAYRAVSAILGIEYRKLPCEILEYRNQKRFDWQAHVDVARCVAAVATELKKKAVLF